MIGEKRMMVFILTMAVGLVLSIAGGCGERPSGEEMEQLAERRVERKEERKVMPAAEPKAEKRVVEVDKLFERKGLLYVRKESDPFTGTAVDYWPNGNKRAEGIVVDGKPHGKETWWHENGRKWKEVEYRDGEEISSKVWDQ